MEEKEYNELILELVNNFKKSIPASETKLVVAFQEYLYYIIETTKNSDSKFIRKDKTSVENFLKRATNTMINYDLDMKRKSLIADVNFQEIKKISLETYHTALELLEGKQNKTNSSYSHYKEKLPKLLELVESYNKDEARMLVSETMLDLDFIENPETEILSLRLGHIKYDTYNRDNEEEER